MKLEVINIGNSRGFRIPKAILEECCITDYVDAEIKNKSLVITPMKKKRHGWSDAFKKETAMNEDSPLDVLELKNTWDDSEWTW